MSVLKPGDKVPDLSVHTTEGNVWDIQDASADNFHLVVFYRGLHCPVCKKYLEDFNSRIEDFWEIGVSEICISVNNMELAQRTVEEWNIDKLKIGYGLNVDVARTWGAYISKASKQSEPDFFTEPALYLVQPNRILYSANVQSHPFARPQFSELYKAIRFIVKDDYPAKGGV